jgi:eukaryotic-like serine/threonine-protein kinase
VDFDVGHIVAGKYTLVRRLGAGTMGEVWLARHMTLGGEVALKLMEPAHDPALMAVSRFQQEAQIGATLSRRTRHIVSVTDHGEDRGVPYLVMELLEGESLDARILRGPLPPDEVARIVSQVARTLRLAHAEAILHRDLKPANLWLTRDEDGELLVKVLDFGIARARRPQKTRSPLRTGKDIVLGSPSYMSPEQARGLPSLDHRCDLWALAVSAYEALTGEVPFEGQTLSDMFIQICAFRWVPIRQRRPDLSPAIEAFFARAFAPDLAARFASADELADAFAAAAAMAPPSVRIRYLDPHSSLGGQASSLRPRPERRAHRAGIAFAAFAVLLAGAGASLLRNGPTPVRSSEPPPVASDLPATPKAASPLIADATPAPSSAPLPSASPPRTPRPSRPSPSVDKNDVF